MKYLSSQMGTLFQLRGPINRTGVPLDPSDNVKGPRNTLLSAVPVHPQMGMSYCITDGCM